MNETGNRLTFENGTTKAFDGIELGKPDQIKVYNACPQYPGKNVARILQRPGDLWAGKYVRCLCAKYDTNEQAGQHYRYVLSVSIPGSFGTFGNNLLWELHHRSNLYNLDKLGVAPIAIDSNGGKWSGRVQAGYGTIGTGYATRIHSDFAQIKYDRRLDFGIDLKLSEGNDGHFYIYYNDTGNPDVDMFTKTPVWTHEGPTLPYANNGAHVGTGGLYCETGIYSGKSSVGETDALDYFGVIRRPGNEDMKDVITSIGAAGPAPPPDPPPVPVPPVVRVTGNIQVNDKVKAGSEWVLTTSRPIDQMNLAVNGVQTKFLVPGDHFRHVIPNDVALGAGKLEIGAIIGGAIVTHWGPFDVEFIKGDVPAPPVETNKQHVDEALKAIDAEWVDLKSTEVGLKGKTGYPVPHWKNAHDASNRAVAAIKKIT